MLNLQIEKHGIFVDKVDVVRRRIEHLNRWPLSRSLIVYKNTQLLPRHFIITGESSVGDALEDLEPLQHPMNKKQAHVVMKGIVRALYALHGRQLVHGHLRLEVLRMHRSSGTVLLGHHVLPIDLFVPSSTLGREVWRCCAPEIKRNSAFGYSADIWALGAVFVQLLAPKGKLYETEDLLEMDILSPCLAQLGPSAISFVVQCLQEDVSSRPTIAELLIHPFLCNANEWSDDEANTSDSDNDDSRSTSKSGSSSSSCYCEKAMSLTGMAAGK